MVREMLAPHGLVVIEAADGESGIASFVRQRPSIVLMDLLMPGKEGIETIREIRATGLSVYIIAMSGGGAAHNFDFLDAARKLGADDSLAKPFRLVDLTAKIEAARDRIREK